MSQGSSLAPSVTMNVSLSSTVITVPVMSTSQKPTEAAEDLIKARKRRKAKSHSSKQRSRSPARPPTSSQRIYYTTRLDGVSVAVSECVGVDPYTRSLPPGVLSVDGHIDVYRLAHPHTNDYYLNTVKPHPLYVWASVDKSDGHTDEEGIVLSSTVNSIGGESSRPLSSQLQQQQHGSSSVLSSRKGPIIHPNVTIEVKFSSVDEIWRDVALL